MSHTSVHLARPCRFGRSVCVAAAHASIFVVCELNGSGQTNSISSAASNPKRTSRQLIRRRRTSRLTPTPGGRARSNVSPRLRPTSPTITVTLPSRSGTSPVLSSYCVHPVPWCATSPSRGCGSKLCSLSCFPARVRSALSAVVGGHHISRCPFGFLAKAKLFSL